MKTFLSFVAQDILAKYGTDLSQVAVVFPNKRASLFLNQHLARLAGGRPLWSPAYLTISELFRLHSRRQVADPIKLVCELYKSFVAQTGTDETLDHFYGWGQLLLSDFDDIDKQMADADHVFANLADLHEMDDDSYLTDEQRDVLRRFFGNFSDSHNSELKQRFLTLWSHMADIYHDFNRRLEAQGLAYEGALYREVVSKNGLTENGEFRTENGELRTENGELRTERYDYSQGGEPTDSKTNHTSQFSVLSSQLNSSQLNSSQFILFVGFNALLKVEQRLFTLLRREGKARFYWDFDHYYMKGNEAGHFIGQYLTLFPNELGNEDADIYDCMASPKDITIASATTENIQARYATQWLRRQEPGTVGADTAVVLCNEALLPAVIHSLPSEVEHVNITTGFPLSQTSMPALISALIGLRRDGYDHQRGCFRLRQVNTLLQHPYLISASPQTSALVKQLKEENNYHPTSQQLSADDLTALLFQPFPPQHQNELLLSWLCQVVKAIARTPATDVLREESIFNTYTLLNRLLSLAQAGDLVTDSITLGRLITQLMQTTTIPFHGEPIEGLQIMGLLETRNLDFRHLLILSAQEGNMPRLTSDTSFIPYSLRRAYGLTISDHKVAIYSYYFHRLLQRADDVTIVYNNATTDGQKGEMSRFLLQLMATPLNPPEGGKSSSPSGMSGGVAGGKSSSPSGMSGGVAGGKSSSPSGMSGGVAGGESSSPSGRLGGVITLLSLQGYQNSTPRQPQPVENRARKPQLLSPTAINNYLRCPLRFHYRYVCNLPDSDDNDGETIDNRIFGNIFHEASQMVYTRLVDSKGGFAARPQILSADLERLLKSGVEIRQAVDEAFRQELHLPHHFSLPGRSGGTSSLSGLQLISREVIVHYLRQLISNDRQLAPFTILSLEEEYSMSLPLPSGDSINIGGRVDRLDMVRDAGGNDLVRVIDYKTGAHRMKSLPDVDAIFRPEFLKEHSDYYLQAMLYAVIVARRHPALPVAPALLFIQHAGAQDYDPVLRFGRKPILDVSACEAPFLQQLSQTVGRMFDHAQPLVPTADRQRCQSCPYRLLCR